VERKHTQYVEDVENMHIMLEKKYAQHVDLEEHQKDGNITGQNNTKKQKCF